MVNILDSASGTPWLKHRVIYLTKHGSQAYGTNIATSDTDIKGVAVPPPEYFLGFNKHFEQAEFHKPDMVIFDIRKFIGLAADCNPNVIEVLYTDPADHLYTTPQGELLLAYKSHFLSQRAKHTFSGYATGELKKISKESMLTDKGRKHAMHLVRLLRMGKEIVSTGQVLVKRPDKDELLAIRAGAWSYEQVQEWAESQKNEIKTIPSTLPETADKEFLDKLCVKIVESSFDIEDRIDSHGIMVKDRKFHTPSARAF